REQATNRLFAQDELPTTAYVCAVRPEQVNVDFAEGELAHFLPFCLVALLVALQGRLPAFRLLLAGEEAKVRGVPVAGHEAFQLALVPGGFLGVEDLADSFLRGIGVGWRLGGHVGNQRDKDQATSDRRHGGTNGVLETNGHERTPEFSGGSQNRRGHW